MASVRVAVFPAAGLGTRFLPATKAQPKEMLPLVDRPLVQYVVEEACAAGLDRIVIVTGRGKNAIEDHFDTSFELEKMLEERGKNDLLEQVRAIAGLARVSYVRQKSALGLGHAVLQARDLVGHEPFAVMLGDDIVDAEEPCIGQMIRVFERRGNPVIALQEVPHEQTRQYGIVAARKARGEERVVEISDMVEKPHPESAPRDLPHPRGHGVGRRRRDPAHLSPEDAPQGEADRRISLRGKTLRRRRQARVSRSDRRVRAEEEGPGGAVSGLPQEAKARLRPPSCDS
jgi:UTP-glucose-1-phosphate uridylyltransferase